MILENNFPYLSTGFGINSILGLIGAFKFGFEAESLVEYLVVIAVFIYGIYNGMVVYALKTRKIWAYKFMLIGFCAIFGLFFYFIVSEESFNLANGGIFTVIIFSLFYWLVFGFLTYHVYEEINNDPSKNI